jgi:hypothetical protein
LPYPLVAAQERLRETQAPDSHSVALRFCHHLWGICSWETAGPSRCLGSPRHQFIRHYLPWSLTSATRKAPRVTQPPLSIYLYGFFCLSNNQCLAIGTLFDFVAFYGRRPGREKERETKTELGLYETRCFTFLLLCFSCFLLPWRYGDWD